MPYKGANPGLADFYSGHLPMFAASISPQVLEMHRLGKIRILVAGSPRRLAGAPEIPISSEVGYPDLITLQFMGVFAPGGTPAPVVDQIAKATHEVMADKVFQDKLIAAASGLKVLTPFGMVEYRPIDHQSTMGAYVGRIGVKDGKGYMKEWRFVDGKDALPSDAEVKKMRPAN